MRFRKESIEWKDVSTNLSRKEQVVVSRLRTGYTQATHRHVIEKTPSPEFQREREREKRYRNHERGMDRRTAKTDRIYEENRIIPWNMNKDYV
jgi:hypothetical protein